MTHTHPEHPDAASQLHTHGHVIRWARHYDRVMALFTLGNEAAFRKRIVESAQLRPGERVLDVGCGTGTLALLAARAVGPQGLVVGIDPSPEMIAQARAKTAAPGASPTAAPRFELAAIERLPFDDASFDVVLSSLMFHHLPAREQRLGLAELRRVLAPGGRLLIVDFPGGGPLLHRLLGRVLHRHGAQATEHGHALGRVASLANELGFENAEIAAFKPRFLQQLSARAGAAR
jgi:ubiquinone/menaquinone biosynthesis C-methylase UbiE